MNLRTLKLYLLYLLPTVGIGGKLIGWLTMTHNFFFDWVTEGMILLFLLLEAPAIHRKLNPGVRMLQAAASGEKVFQQGVKNGWLWLGMAIRLLLVLVSASLAVLLLFIHPPQYLLAGMLLYLAGIALFGMASYVSHNPFRIIVSNSGIHIYTFRYQETKWSEIVGIEEKKDWLVIQRRKKADLDIEFEDLKSSQHGLLSRIKNEAKSRNIPYQDSREEYD